MGAADSGLMVAVLMGTESTSIAGVGVAGVVEFARGMGAVTVMGTVGCMGVANDGLVVVVLAMEGPACSGSGIEGHIKGGAGDRVGVAGDGRMVSVGGT